ncbi:MAG TPA: TrpB-like pyridoxal phosphate-dependent enzyme [bacterium]|nr:TrpB-like pyridoxal phosphate-dependent enzyme [bacterium]HNS48168.1 TrpB-like pyridoxal phosphate-dependent enzyme [bacterium]
MEERILLSEKEIPQQWYNLLTDLKTPLAPPRHPATGEPLKPEDLYPIFPKSLVAQEVSSERWIEIPDPILEIYRLWRPTPLCRARRLEKALGTKAQIWYKYEGASPAGSHKPNTAIAQAYYNKQEGVTRLSTETGAGQWGSALSLACQLLGLKCTVYMVKGSYEQKPYRRIMMETWGAEVFASPSDKTESGRRIQVEMPGTPGSLGIAISEAVEDAATHEDTKYSLGSVLNHVCLHQTVVGLETKKQFKLAGLKPDILIGCVGGGSNFAGLVFPFVPEKLAGQEMRFIAVESAACPSLTRGQFAYDFGDTAGLTPLLKMFSIGHRFVPAPVHAGGLRYHGMAPMVSHLMAEKLIEARAYQQKEVFEAALLFARTEGIIPAPETNHALKAAIDVARECREEKVILINFSGHGHFDLSAYEAFLTGRMTDSTVSDETLNKSMGDLKKI